MRRHTLRLVNLGLLLLSSFLSGAIANADEAQHLGVTSCASSTCHGSTVPFADSNIIQNEFRTWFEKDPHARAYQTLLTEQSQSIGQKLGLESTHTAAICLECHTDFVSVEQRGEAFSMEDGVGCEVCHGGAEGYLESHTRNNHNDNLSAGLIQLEDASIRGKLCVSCHVGDHPTRQITHAIMGAGHPRLSFELNTFSSIQPAHYQVDEDYIERKGSVNELHLWASGQVAAADQLLNNLKSSPRSGLFPELAHMNCLACHQSMKNLRWSFDPISQLPAGALRYQDAHLIMSYRISQVVAPAMAADFLAAIKQFLGSSSHSGAVASLATKAQSHLTLLLEELNRNPISPSQATSLINNLANYGIESGHNSLASAEQLVMGLNSLLSATSATSLNADHKQRLIVTMNNLFETVADTERYDANQFVAQLKQVQKLSNEAKQ